ncbi:superoxide dismutase [Bowmanella sp. Y26]|uniref:superoxide dismutase n=1 Tax=Bowmanella yangjiangensis TaxID=2811230 RepID=UPI001BDBB57A|nr:superoxide dismutase [Bowmanella yangjiangensis]MBT1065443.1 superoxide dismutase [Bowmanella yangjiangensis]
MPFELPSLPYPYDALEPYLDSLTMEIHHGRHHQAYVNKLNQALTDTPYTSLSLEKLLGQLNELPHQLQAAVRDHGGGHANHSLFWTILSPNGQGRPDGELALAIDQHFGSFAQFQNAFTQAALSRFGSGWAWLSLNTKGQLVVESSANQDSPLMHGHTPILGLDVWEHAYYLKYQNKRADYIEAIYQVINWPEVARRYRQAR